MGVALESHDLLAAIGRDCKRLEHIANIGEGTLENLGHAEICRMRTGYASYERYRAMVAVLILMVRFFERHDVYVHEAVTAASGARLYVELVSCSPDHIAEYVQYDMTTGKRGA